jgi:hypothetical protein
MKDATKKKTVNVSIRLSEAEYQMAKELMQDLEFKTITALTREMYREAYKAMKKVEK